MKQKSEPEMEQSALFFVRRTGLLRKNMKFI